MRSLKQMWTFKRRFHYKGTLTMFESFIKRFLSDSFLTYDEKRELKSMQFKVQTLLVLLEENNADSWSLFEAHNQKNSDV